MTLELGKGMLLALQLGRLKDQGSLRPEQVSLGKLNNVREAIEIARQCRTILGAAGITLEYPLMRHANNLESVPKIRHASSTLFSFAACSMTRTRQS